jgi:hypothetical protein
MNIFKEALNFYLISQSYTPIRTKAIKETLESITEEAISAKADAIVLQWWGTYGKEPTDSKSYRELVSEVINAFNGFFNKEDKVSFETAIETLTDSRKSIIKRLQTISDSKVVNNHLSEKAELERQLEELNSAIYALSK